MKFYILILIAGLPITLGLCQDVEWAPIGATWHYEVTPEPYRADVTTWTRFTAVKDSIVQSDTMRLIKVDSPSYSPLQVDQFLIKQAGDQLYYQMNDSLHLLYDFTLAPGDTLRIRDPNGIFYIRGLDPHTYVVESVDQIEINGQVRRRQMLQSIEGSGEYGPEIIEGIGSTGYSFFPSQTDLFDQDYFSGMRCYQDPSVGLVKYKEIACDFDNTFLLRQRPVEWLPIGAKWWYEASYRCRPICGDNDGSTYTKIELVGDTIIGGETARIASLELGPGLDSSEVFVGHTMILKQDRERLLIYTQDSFRVLYDFSLDVGDTLVSAFPIEVVVDYYGETPEGIDARAIVESIELVEMHGLLRRKMTVRQIGFSGVGHEIIEGLGGSQWFLPYNTCPVCIPEFQGHLGLRCYFDGTTLYGSDTTACADHTLVTSLDDNLSHQAPIIYPNPTHQEVRVKMPGGSLKLDQMGLYNIQGVQINLTGVQLSQEEIRIENLDKGLYFLHYLKSSQSTFIGKIVVLE